MVFIPDGLNFQDGYALAMLQNGFAIASLENEYQVVIAVYNQMDTLENGRQIAAAIEALGRYRLALAAERGVAADRDLRLIGHSNGAISGESALGELSPERTYRQCLRGAFPQGSLPLHGGAMAWTRCAIRNGPGSHAARVNKRGQ